MLPVITAIATVSGTVAALLPLLQIARLRRHRDGNALSVPFIGGVVMHLSIWTIYGIALHNPTLVFTSSLSLATNGTMLGLTLSLRRAAARARAQAPLQLAVLDEQELVAEIADDAGVVRNDADQLTKLEPVVAA